MLDTVGLIAIQVLFVVAALTPVALVILYYWPRVSARREAICELMTVAFGPEVSSNAPPPSTAAERECRAARRALKDNLYISNFEKTFDACHRKLNYAFPLATLTVLTVGMCFVLYTWVRMQMTPAWADGPVARLPLPIIMALAGGYVWTLYQVVSRVITDELGPSHLVELNLGLLSCVPIGFALSLITLEAKQLPAMAAFAASAFPLRDLNRFFQEQTMKRGFGIEAAAKTLRPAERGLGTAIDGLSDYTLIRLAELRIVTVLDMAYSDPVRVQTKTGYPLPLVVDWIDQSLLALYVGEKRSELTPMGLRCSLDVYEFVEQHQLWIYPRGHEGGPGYRGTPTGTHLDVLKAVAAKLEVHVELVHDLFLRIYADPQVAVIRRLWYLHGAPSMVSFNVAGLVPDAPEGVTIQEVTPDALGADEAFWRLYEASFASTEREPKDVIVRSIERGPGFALTAVAEGRTVGLATGHVLDRSAATFLIYLAVDPAWRSKQLGRTLFNATDRWGASRLASKGQPATGIVWEVDDPATAVDAAELEVRQKRLRFFEHLGGKALGTPYLQPPVDGVTEVPMRLMFRPSPGMKQPQGDEINALIRAIYLEKYGAINGIPSATIDRLFERVTASERERV